MYSYGGPCIAVEGRVSLWMAMYSYGGPCIAVEGPIGIFITMYRCVWLCILFLLASLYLGTSNHYMITTLSTYLLQQTVT